jgi:hypothetical protein
LNANEGSEPTWKMEYVENSQNVRQIDNRIWGVYAISFALVATLFGYLGKNLDELSSVVVWLISAIIIGVAISMTAIVAHLQNASDAFYRRLRKLEGRVGLHSHRMFWPNLPISGNLPWIHRLLCRLRTRNVMGIWAVAIIVSALAVAVVKAQSIQTAAMSQLASPPSEAVADSTGSDPAGINGSPSAELSQEHTKTPRLFVVDILPDYFNLAIAAAGVLVILVVGWWNVRQMRRDTQAQIAASQESAQEAQRETARLRLQSDLYDRLADVLDDYQTRVSRLSDQLEVVQQQCALYASTGYGAPRVEGRDLYSRLETTRADPILAILRNYSIVFDNVEDLSDRLSRADASFYKAFRLYLSSVEETLADAPESRRELVLARLREEREESLAVFREAFLAFRDRRRSLIAIVEEVRSRAQDRLLRKWL